MTSIVLAPAPLEQQQQGRLATTALRLVYSEAAVMVESPADAFAEEEEETSKLHHNDVIIIQSKEESPEPPTENDAAASSASSSASSSSSNNNNNNNNAEEEERTLLLRDHHQTTPGGPGEEENDAPLVLQPTASSSVTMPVLEEQEQQAVVVVVSLSRRLEGDDRLPSGALKRKARQEEEEEPFAAGVKRARALSSSLEEEQEEQSRVISTPAAVPCWDPMASVRSSRRIASRQHPYAPIVSGETSSGSSSGVDDDDDEGRLAPPGPPTARPRRKRHTSSSSGGATKKASCRVTHACPIEVRQKLQEAEGGFGPWRVFASQNDAASFFGVAQANFSNLLRGKASSSIRARFEARRQPHAHVEEKPGGDWRRRLLVSDDKAVLREALCEVGAKIADTPPTVEDDDDDDPSVVVSLSSSSSMVGDEEEGFLWELVESCESDAWSAENCEERRLSTAEAARAATLVQDDDATPAQIAAALGRPLSAVLGWYYLASEDEDNDNKKEEEDPASYSLDGLLSVGVKRKVRTALDAAPHLDIATNELNNIILQALEVWANRSSQHSPSSIITSVSPQIDGDNNETSSSTTPMLI